MKKAPTKTTVVNEEQLKQPVIKADDLKLEEVDGQSGNLAQKIEPTRSFMSSLKTPTWDTSSDSDNVFFSDRKPAPEDETLLDPGNERVALYPSISFLRDVVNSYIGKQHAIASASDDPGDCNFLKVPKF